VFRQKETSLPDLSLDLRNLRCAIAAAEAKSFRRAAAALELPQSSISRRVQALEHRLGFAVFERSRAGVQLTKAGAAFLEGASSVANQLDFAKRHAKEVNSGKRGAIRIGFTPSRTGGRLREVLSRFNSMFPNVISTLTEGTPAEVRHAVSIGKLDVGFVTGIDAVPGCEVLELWQEAVYAVLPTGHRLANRSEIALSETLDDIYILSNREPDAEECLISRFAGFGRRPTISFHDVSGSSIFDLVAMGYGITLTFESAIRKEIEGVVFRPILGAAGTSKSLVIWPTSNGSPIVPKLIAVAQAIGQDGKPSIFMPARSKDISNRT
jgi:DNA-binding transcriptional LysR family regulator